jgi:hypothetical protein
MKTIPLWLTLGLIACGDKDGTTTDDSEATDDSAVEGDADADADADSDTDADSDADTDADSDTDPEQDPVWDTIDTEGCEEVSGSSDVPGAVSVYVGEFTKSGSTFAGKETWALYANAAWKATGEDDCKIVWNITGVTSGTGSCSSCDYGMSISATLDVGATTCPEGLYEDEESYTVTYGVAEPGDGSATFYYASSGNKLGVGLATSTTVSYASEERCAWF